MSGLCRTWHWSDDLSVLSDCLDQGGLLAVPTESSYGLATDPLSDLGVGTLFRLKGRSSAKALPVVLGDIEQLRRLGGDPTAPELADFQALWPAPVTLIVPIRQPIPASGGGRTLAVRIPAHARLRSLLLDLGRPLTATSANPAGGQPVCDTEALQTLLGGWQAVIVDDGSLPGGPPSTILEPVEGGYRVLRQGAVDREWLQGLISRPLFSAGVAEIPADESAEYR